jgi:hypothetical protein
MNRTPAPVLLAAARALQPPEGSRAAEVFRDDHVWIRFAPRPTSGPRTQSGAPCAQGSRSRCGDAMKKLKLTRERRIGS